jgi:hypothetical protein
MKRHYPRICEACSEDEDHESCNGDVGITGLACDCAVSGHQLMQRFKGKLKIKLDNLADEDGLVTVYAADYEHALYDQTIRGSSWEAPADMDVAYASISDEPNLVVKLEADGYEVDADDYTPTVWA